jgi:hypothetical protein
MVPVLRFRNTGIHRIILGGKEAMMETPLLDAIAKYAAPQPVMGFNSGFAYFPMDVDPQAQTKVEEPEPPETVKETLKARSTTSKKAPKGPQATAMTAQKDNVANYQPKGIS